jgi:hypothetical protein
MIKLDLNTVAVELECLVYREMDVDLWCYLVLAPRPAMMSPIMCMYVCSLVLVLVIKLSPSNSFGIIA